MSDLSTDVRVLQEWRKDVVDPALTDLSHTTSSLKTGWDKLEGKLVVITWINGLIATLIVGLLIALFTWGLSNFKLKVQVDPMQSKSTINHALTE